MKLIQICFNLFKKYIIFVLKKIQICFILKNTKIMKMKTMGMLETWNSGNRINQLLRKTNNLKENWNGMVNT